MKWPHATLWALTWCFNQSRPHTLSQASTTDVAHSVHFTMPFVQQTIVETKYAMQRSETTHFKPCNECFSSQGRKTEARLLRAFISHRQVTLALWVSSRAQTLACTEGKSDCLSDSVGPSDAELPTLAGARAAAGTGEAPRDTHSSWTVGEIKISESRWKDQPFYIGSNCGAM